MTLTPRKTEQWHLDRRDHVGASEVAAIMGFSPYETATEVYLRKTGQTEPVVENTPQTDAGTLLEPMVIDRAVAEVDQDADQVLVVLPQLSGQHGHLQAGPDAVVQMRSGKRWLVEAKTTSVYEYLERPPVYWLLQVQAQLLCFPQATHAVLAVMFVGKGLPLQTHRVDHHAPSQAAIADAVSKFWSLVESRTPPEPTTVRDVALVADEQPGKSIKADADTQRIADDYAALTESISLARQTVAELTEQRDSLGALIAAKMGAATLMRTDGGVFTFKTVERSGHYVKPSASRQLKWRKTT